MEVLVAEVFGGVGPDRGCFGAWSQPSSEVARVEKEANAALIAAAPSLLAACQAVLLEDNGMYATAEVRAAIALAGVTPCA